MTPWSTEAGRPRKRRGLPHESEDEVQVIPPVGCRVIARDQDVINDMYDANGRLKVCRNLVEFFSTKVIRN